MFGGSYSTFLYHVNRAAIVQIPHKHWLMSSDLIFWTYNHDEKILSSLWYWYKFVKYYKGMSKGDMLYNV